MFKITPSKSLCSYLAFASATIALWLLSLLLAASASALTAADIFIDQDDNGLNIIVENPDIENLTIHYAQVESSLCQRGLDPSLLQELTVINGKQSVLGNHLLTASSYCFKLSAENLNNLSVVWQSYQLRQRPNPQPPTIEEPLDSQKPIIQTHRSRNSLTIYSEDDDLDQSTWRWQTFEERADCQTADLTLTTRNPALKISLREVDNGKYICASVADKSSNRAFIGYAVSNVDTTRPTINIEQKQRMLLAEADEDVSGWQHTYSPQDLSCNSATFLNNRTVVNSRQATLTNDKINYSYCFRAADQTDNYGYAKYLVQSVDFASVTMRLQQDGWLLVVKPDKPISSWSFLKTAENLACNQETDFAQAQSGSATNSLTLQASDQNMYICVRALNAANSSGYAKLQVAPPLKLQVENNQLLASSTRSNLQWAYIKTKDEIECDSDNSLLFTASNIDYYAGQKADLYESDNGQWLCFRASSPDQSLILYGKQQIDGVNRVPADQAGQNNARRDVLLLAAGFIFTLSLFFVYKIRRFKGVQAHLKQPPAKQPLKSRKKHQESELAKSQPSDLVQPLDFLKGSGDEDQNKPD